MEQIFVTITGQNHYLGMKPYKVGRIVKLQKEPDNEYDETAIAVLLPYIDKVGFVANSTNTVFAGTYSAGRLYDRIGDCAYAQVMFITHSSIIARVLSEEELTNIAATPAEDAGESTGVRGGMKLKIGF